MPLGDDIANYTMSVSCLNPSQPPLIRGGDAMSSLYPLIGGEEEGFVIKNRPCEPIFQISSAIVSVDNRR